MTFDTRDDDQLVSRFVILTEVAAPNTSVLVTIIFPRPPCLGMLCIRKSRRRNFR